MNATATAAALAALLDSLAADTPAHLSTLIEDTDSYGTGDDDGDTAVGNYLALRLLIGGVPAQVLVQYHTVTAVDLHTRAVLARGEMTGGLAELRDLIEEEDTEFAHLHQAGAVEASRGGAADRAEEAATGPIWERADTDDADFFDLITGMWDGVNAPALTAVA